MTQTRKAGVTLPPYPFRIERVKIREFAAAIGDDNPIYTDQAAAIQEGYLDTPCPPTFFTLAMQEFTGAYLKAFEVLGIQLAKVLHGEEEYEYLKEAYPGDVLTCRMTVESLVEKESRSGKMALITLATLFSTQSGDPVLRSRSLIIERL